MNQFTTERVTLFRIECDKETLGKIFELTRTDDRFQHRGSGPKTKNLRVVPGQFTLTLHVSGTAAVRNLTDLLLECGSIKAKL
jgi:hypothetical protein